MQVNVTAQQFAWRFDYPEQGVTSTELHAPSGTQLELHLNALDVLHSFWVPEWGIKRDLVPGSDLPGGDDIDNVVRVTPDVEGVYSVVCTELCGWGHSTMRAAAVVESQAEFDAWVEDADGDPTRERRALASGGGQRRRASTTPLTRVTSRRIRASASSAEDTGTVPRALLGMLIGGAFGFGLVVALRAISGLEIFQTEQTGYPHVIVPAITAPIGFLVGLGCFDYWFRWASGAPTIPDDHSQHGADDAGGTTSSSTPITR